MGGPAPAIDIATLPQLPQIVAKSHSIFSKQSVSFIALVITIFVLTVGTIVYLVRRRFVNADLLEDWEIEFGPQGSHSRICSKLQKDSKTNILSVEGDLDRCTRAYFQHLRPKSQ